MMNKSSALTDSDKGLPPRPGVLSMIGNTPLVPIKSLSPNPKVEIYAKLEKANPGGSVKDRIALSMIEAAEQAGDLRPGHTILEATSGNTGIGLAMVAATKGYPITLAMSKGVSVERRKILAAFGAEFLLTPAELGTDGAIEHVYNLINEESDRFFLTDQYNNDANIFAHYTGTAPEIWEQTQGRLTHFVATIGTTGTLMGCSKRFRELNPKIRIIGVEPYLGHKLQGLKNLKEAYVPGIYASAGLDRKINIEDEAAWEMTRQLAKREGLLVGMSSGAAMYVAHETAKELESGVIVAIFPDGGERYLSTPLFQLSQPETLPLQLHVFNTLSRQYEPFEPKGSEATMYSCGPTVHRRPHVGVLRRLLVDDLVRRTLEFAGHSVKHVVSITDIDDITISEADRQGISLSELCRKHEAEFHEDMAALGVKPPQVYARSSESVDDMINLTRELVDRGYAYERHRSVYFNIGRLETYGELSSGDLGKIQAGATVDEERYDTDDPRDFVLFRRCDLGEMRKGLGIKTEWGNVRPSWHIQCSAMARAHLGEKFDIHMGSVDLVFPHNENEIAQCRGLTGEAQARYWLHSELVLVDEQRITYSEDQYLSLPDCLAKGYTARELRYFFVLQTHYRQPVHYNADQMAKARESVAAIDAFVERMANIESSGKRLSEVQSWIHRTKDSFCKAIFDDFNIAGGVSAVFRLLKQIDHYADEGRLHKEDASDVIALLRDFDQVLGILPQ